MDAKRRKNYLADLISQCAQAKSIIVEKPCEIVDPIIGLQLWEFEVLTGEDAYCADEEIFMDFQGKEMRIYIEDGRLHVYTD